MLVKILGWLLILWGIFFFIKPEILRRKLQRKITKKLKKYLFLIAMFLGFLFINAAWKSEGLPARLFMVLGVIAIFKGFFFLKAKAAQKLMEWFCRQPPIFFRWAAACHIAIGISIILGK